MTAKSQQGDWVTVELDGCAAHCRVDPHNGHTAIREIHIVPIGSNEINITALRGLTRSAVLIALEPSDRERNEIRREELHGRRSSRREDLLAYVAIAHQEYEEAGSATPDLDVYNALKELHEIESSPDWPPGQEKLVGRAYTRGSVRTLILDARLRGYREAAGGCKCPPEQCTCIPTPAEYSALATLDHAERRKAMWSYADK